MSRLEQLLRSEPALFTNFLTVAAALVAAFWVGGVTQIQMSAIVVIGTAVITLASSALARPVQVSLLTGSIVTGLTAAAAFGLKLGPTELAEVTTVLSTILTLILRGHITPTVSLRSPQNPTASLRPPA
jgi:hypothetical protein